jgi:hypothetical protein
LRTVKPNFNQNEHLVLNIINCKLCHKKKLQAQESGVNWKNFIANDSTNAFNKADTVEHGDGFEFSDEQTDEYFDLMKSKDNQKISLTISENPEQEEEEINVDDI